MPRKGRNGKVSWSRHVQRKVVKESSKFGSFLGWSMANAKIMWKVQCFLQFFGWFKAGWVHKVCLVKTELGRNVFSEFFGFRVQGRNRKVWSEVVFAWRFGSILRDMDHFSFKPMGLRAPKG